MNKKVIPCKLNIVIEHSVDDVESHILRYLRSMAKSKFSYVFKNQDIRCYTSKLEIKLAKNKILKFKLNPQCLKETEIYNHVNHTLQEIFLKKHPRKFGFVDGDRRQKIMRGLDSCMIVSTGDNKKFFKTTRELFKLYQQNKSNFEQHDIDVIEACKKMMAEIKNREGKPFYSFTEIE